MALRNQPYIPLYIQDFLTDEKLMECSAQSTGVYIRIMCIMHKSDEYGVILLKQKDKQTDKQINNFALKLAKFLPYSFDVILSSLNELISEGVLLLDNDKLIQKRMVKDNDISEKRAIAGKKGGNNNKFAQAKCEAKEQANSEYECEIEDENKINPILYKRTFEEIKDFFREELKQAPESDPVTSEFNKLCLFMFKDGFLGEGINNLRLFSHLMTFDEYKHLIKMGVTNKFIQECLESMANDDSYTQKKNSLFLTLKNWYNRKQK
jgi:uncharacterized protein YdaU (DUF1376 family)